MKLWEGILNAIFVITEKPTITISKTLGSGFVNPKWRDFAERFRLAGEKTLAAAGIPWRFAMIQSGHESRHGESVLTKDANNLFGLTGDSWYTTGKPVYWIETTERNKEGMAFTIRRPFRKYDSWEASIIDWVSLITRLYYDAHQAAQRGDFEGFARGLETRGYATDRDPVTKKLVYAKKLIELNNSLEGIA